MSASIDDTYQAVVDDLPGGLRAAARDILGGARWEDFFQLEPCRDLPVFAAVPELGLGDDQLAAWRRAHHAACFYGVLADRLADRQLAPSAERDRLLFHLLDRWRRALAEADGDAALADRLISRSMRLWAAGVRAEQAALGRRALGLRRYARLVLFKLGWGGLAAERALRRLPDAHRVACFRRAYLLLMLSLQCVDDAVDAGEDAALRGASAPAALGLAPNALFAAGAWLARAVTREARAGGFAHLEHWSSTRAGELQRRMGERITAGDKLAGLTASSALEETCRAMAARSGACGSGDSGAITSSGRSASGPLPRTSSCGTTPSFAP
jgi:hypothetical protein